MKQQNNFDVLIIGSGAAGLTLALKLANHFRVALLSKSGIENGATLYAQGGIAAVWRKEDSLKDHIEDTIKVGDGLCDLKAVEFMVTHGPKSVQWLIDNGINFTKEDSKYHLYQEGGHSHRRIIHVADATGKELEATLSNLAHKHNNISLFENHVAIDAILNNDLCVGAYVYDEVRDKVIVFNAKVMVLASGGASKAYLYSSSTNVASGDGIAIGWRAGCEVCNLEFNQFHPTCLYHTTGAAFLISESLRGEGAHLLLPDGSRFMHKFDSRAEMASRDIVARAIDHEMKRLGIRHVQLDISYKPAKFIKQRFPNIYTRCLEYGFDITKEPIPVVPASHYSCGGIKVDLYGRTKIPNLYAIGEVAHTGVHGANRLASNSLLECIVFAQSASEDIINKLPQLQNANNLKPWDESLVKDSSEEVFVTHNWEEIRGFMWDYVGIVRSNKRLERAAHRIDLLKQEIQDYYGHFRVNRNLLELRNLVIVADLIIKSAQHRKESRGLHYTLDYPNQDPVAKNTVLEP